MSVIIKNKTEGYGYSYASLCDLAEQGIQIPKMKTGTENDKDYIYWYDEELKEWIRGCGIVVSENKGMNKSQNYLAAVTYAKRGTVLMARCVATQDDEDVENTNQDGTSKKPQKATQKQVEYMMKLYAKPDIEAIKNHYQVKDLTELSMDIVGKYIEEAKKRNEKQSSNNN